MIIRTKIEDINRYFDSDALNQSKLKRFTNGIHEYLNNTKTEPTKSMLIGSLVDIILTGTQQDFDDTYYISKLISLPSKLEIDIINTIYNDILCSTNIKDIKELSSYRELIEITVNNANWQPNWKLDTKINKIINNCSEYFNELKLAQTREIISFNIITQAREIANSLKTHQRTKDYFVNETKTNIDIYYQKVIYFKYKTIECKALLDIVIVCKNDDGEILFIEPIDIKTMYDNTIKFPYSLQNYRYDIQAAWYVEALKYHFKVSKDKIKPFKFVVESTNNIGYPLIYEISSELLDTAKKGKQLITSKLKGIDDLITQYLYFLNTGYLEDEIVNKNNGILKLNWEGIID